MRCRSAPLSASSSATTSEARDLVIWEAQHGDFVNGAQVMLDQFVTSARAKWGLRTSLVFLLPHGYEGQGPEHSSARPERILQSAADFNLRLVNCMTSARAFHTSAAGVAARHRPVAAVRADAKEPVAPSSGGIYTSRAVRRPLLPRH